MDKLICRICLSENVRMRPIENTELHVVYERLCQDLLVKDKITTLACYLCYAKLRNSYQLMLKCCESQNIFTQMLYGSKDDTKPIKDVKLSNYNRLLVSAVQFSSISAAEASLKDVCDVHVKVETVVEVKREIADDDGEDGPPEPDVFEENFNPHVKPDTIEYASSEVPDSVPSEKVVSYNWAELTTDEGKTGKSLGSKKRCAVNKTDLHRKRVKSKEEPIYKKGEKPYKCEICNRNFAAKGFLINHNRIHTGEKTYKCYICKVVYNTKCELDKHYYEHFKCDICQKSFSQKAALKTHLRIHTGEKPFKCDTCHKGFNYKEVLITHIRSHTGEKPYLCNMCPSSFRTKRHLTDHIRLHTGEKPYQCEICQKYFRVRSALLAHARIHTGEKPYKCDVCQKTFSQMSGLHCHLRTHAGEKPYKCAVCDKSFMEKHGLKIHLRIHTGEKPFECSICERRFRTKNHVKLHRRIHFDDRPFKCDVCENSFKRINELRNHVRIHTGEKPFECDICKKSFRQMSTLKNHIRIVHTG